MKNEEAIKGMKKGFRHALAAKFVVFKAWNCLLVHCEWLSNLKMSEIKRDTEVRIHCCVNYFHSYFCLK